MLHLPATMASQPCNKPDPSIVKAAEAGDMKEVAEFVANGASVNSVDRVHAPSLLLPIIRLRLRGVCGVAEPCPNAQRWLQHVNANAANVTHH
eukprot:m.347991 g.347991  ORF g.347991 m.347991 type:complete len:93 (-) comp27934_c1_seq9:1190-1468(-)